MGNLSTIVGQYYMILIDMKKVVSSRTIFLNLKKIAKNLFIIIFKYILRSSPKKIFIYELWKLLFIFCLYFNHTNMFSKI